MNKELYPHEFVTRFESTAMPTRGTDVLRASYRLERHALDLDLVKRLGVRRIRYSIPGNDIYAHGSEPDRKEIDPPMAAIKELGIHVIADLVHHTAALVAVLDEDFFASPNLAPWLEEYALAVLEPYGSTPQSATVFNEPYLTTQFCGELGTCCPFRRGSQHLVEMLINVAMARAGHPEEFFGGGTGARGDLRDALGC